MIQQANSENFESLVQDGFVIVDFYGTTCVPCKLFARILEDLDTEIPFLNIVKLNTTDNPQLAAQYHINIISRRCPPFSFTRTASWFTAMWA